VTGSRPLEDSDDLHLQVAFVEAEVEGAVQPDLDGDFVARADASCLTFGNLLLLMVVADREVVVDRACSGLGKEGLQVGPFRELAVRVPGHDGFS